MFKLSRGPKISLLCHCVVTVSVKLSTLACSFMFVLLGYILVIICAHETPFSHDAAHGNAREIALTTGCLMSMTRDLTAWVLRHVFIKSLAMLN